MMQSYGTAPSRNTMHAATAPRKMGLLESAMAEKETPAMMKHEKEPKAMAKRETIMATPKGAKKGAKRAAKKTAKVKK